MKKNLYDLKIKEIDCSKLNVISVTLSDGSRYTADLLPDFKNLFCFPKNIEEWKSAQITEGNFAIEWSTGFDIHFDHIVALSKTQKKSA